VRGPSFWLGDVGGADLLHTSRRARPGYVLRDVSDFRMDSNRGFNDISIDGAVCGYRLWLSVRYSGPATEAG
jgi:hypothetical protein